MKRVTLIVLLPALLLALPGKSTGQDGSVLPAVNRKIIGYVETVIGKKVDRGECWDLACQALERAGAEWDGQYRFGRRYDPEKEEVLPGDIIQFERVKVEYTTGNTTYLESYSHHTAVVYRVTGRGEFELAHQNTGFSGRKVGLSSFRTGDVKKGKMFFYRPVPKQ